MNTLASRDSQSRPLTAITASRVAAPNPSSGRPASASHINNSNINRYPLPSYVRQSHQQNLTADPRDQVPRLNMSFRASEPAMPRAGAPPTSAKTRFGFLNIGGGEPTYRVRDANKRGSVHSSSSAFDTAHGMDVVDMQQEWRRLRAQLLQSLEQREKLALENERKQADIASKQEAVNKLAQQKGYVWHNSSWLKLSESKPSTKSAFKSSASKSSLHKSSPSTSSAGSSSVSQSIADENAAELVLEEAILDLSLQLKLVRARIAQLAPYIEAQQKQREKEEQETAMENAHSNGDEMKRTESHSSLSREEREIERIKAEIQQQRDEYKRQKAEHENIVSQMLELMEQDQQKLEEVESSIENMSAMMKQFFDEKTRLEAKCAAMQAVFEEKNSSSLSFTGNALSGLKSGAHVLAKSFQPTADLHETLDSLDRRLDRIHSTSSLASAADAQVGASHQLADAQVGASHHQPSTSHSHHQSVEHENEHSARHLMPHSSSSSGRASHQSKHNSTRKSESHS